MRNGYYGLAATLLTLVFLALAGEPRAEGATRIDPGALGRVLGLDRAPEVKTIRRKLADLAAAGKAADLIMALARRHAAARPDALGFLYADGHARAYYGTRKIQKTHVARLKFPAPATEETWIADSGGDPVLMVIAEPSDSLAGEVRRLLPRLRVIAGEGRRVTVCFDRGGWSPALFADITEAGFDLLTWRKGPAPDLPAGDFTRVIEHSRSFHRLVKWRTGCEGRISYLKHGYGWDRTRLDGKQGATIWCGHGVFAHNLVKIAPLAS
jgi:Transposase protein